MPRKSRPPKHSDRIREDELWQKAWQEPRKIGAGKKQALLQQVHERIQTSPRKKKLFFISIGAAAAILVAVFIKIPMNAPHTAVNNWQELASNDSLKKILLQDGSELWLAPHSAIRLCAGFPNQRNTELTKGTVFFSVAKNTGQPFSIMVNRQLVTVLGTAFTIHRLDSVDIQLTVKEGKVALDIPANARDDRRLLTAGQQIRTTNANAGMIETIDPAAADWWCRQQVKLYNIPLGELLNRVETVYKEKLSYSGIDEKKKVTLTWDMGIPLEENLSVLNTLTGYKIH